MIKNGDVVYFRKAKRETRKSAPEMQFPKGHGFGVFLGHVPLGLPDVPPLVLLRQMGSIGFISFDDLNEILGEEAVTAIIAKFEDKYYGKAVETEEELKAKEAAIKAEREANPQAEAEPPPPQKVNTLRLVNPQGRPIQSGDNPNDL